MWCLLFSVYFLSETDVLKTYKMILDGIMLVCYLRNIAKSAPGTGFDEHAFVQTGMRKQEMSSSSLKLANGYSMREDI